MKACKIAWETADAYSADIWGPVMWTQAAQMLLDMNFSESETRAILRSKMTRWARDAWCERSTWLGQLAIQCDQARDRIKLGEFGIGEIGEHATRAAADEAQP
jgi:hypothetical protein